MFNTENDGQAMRNSYNDSVADKVKILEKIVQNQSARIETLEKVIIQLLGSDRK